MSKKRQFIVWIFREKGVTYNYVKNWKEAIRYAKKLLKQNDVINVSIDVRKTKDI